MHPLDNSTMRSSGQLSMPQLLRISPSMPTSPNSLTITARRRPPAFSRMWRTNVVLPAPRKPVTMVQGIFVRDAIGNFLPKFLLLDGKRRASRNHGLRVVDGAAAPH